MVQDQPWTSQLLGEHKGIDNFVRVGGWDACANISICVMQ